MTMRAIAILCMLMVGCATQADPGWAERAVMAQKTGELPVAYDLYAQALCDPQEYKQAHIIARTLVDIWDELGRPATPAQKIAACHPDAPLAALVEGLTAGMMAEWILAAEKLTIAEDTGPIQWRADIAVRRGVIALHRGVPAEARDHLARAAALEPSRVEVRLLTAQAYLASRQQVSAIDTLRGILSLKPTVSEIARARRILASAVQDSEPPLSKTEEAYLRNLLGAVEHNEVTASVLAQALDMAHTRNHPRILAVAGLVALKQGARSEGVKLLEQAQTLAPLDPDGPRILSVHHIAANQLDEAYAPLREAAGRDPFDAEVARMLAPAAVNHNDLRLARATYHSLCVLEPTVPANDLGLANTERQLGNLDAARRAAITGLTLAPQDVPLLYERVAIESAAYKAAANDPTKRAVFKAQGEQALAALRKVAPEHPGVAALTQTFD